MLHRRSDKALGKKKWSVCKADGPIALYAEHLVKRLKRHYFQVQWEYYDDETIRLIPERGFPPFKNDFYDVVMLAIRNLNADLRVHGQFSTGYLVGLVGPHFLDARGNLKRAKT